MALLEIDGSFKEGGGQILRTSLALSLVTQTPFRIVNIRQNRAKPGLRRQHLTAIRAAARFSDAVFEGDILNSTELTFRPGPVQARECEFDIGTGGSTTLVFQTIFPALLLANEKSVIAFHGGTHNPGTPPWDFIESVFLPVVRSMGASVATRLERYGFAQGGEGKWITVITPSKLHNISLRERGEYRSRSVRALVSGLPLSIAERELAAVRKELHWPEPQFRSEMVEATGPGNVLMISARFANSSELITGFGERAVSAAKVAKGAAEGWLAYERSEAPVGEYLADQLLLPFALAGGGSFITTQPSSHTETNIHTISKFLPVQFRSEQVSGTQWLISL